MQVVKVDEVGLQTAQAGLAGGLDAGGCPIHGAFAVTDQDAALAGKGEFVAARLEHLADHGLVMPQTVEAGGVEKGVADVQCALQCPLRFGSICGAIGLGHAHAAEP